MTAKTLKIGDAAPDFELKDESSMKVKLSDFRGKRVILYFYPKDDTPGCTKQACGFRDINQELQVRNAVVIGISPDSTKSHQKFKTKHNLPFILLADEDHVVAQTYGVWGEKSMYGKKYLGIIRSHFVIDEAGKFLDVQVGVSPADSIEKALQTIQAGIN